MTDWGKVAAAGSAGAVFPLYLFDKFNIGSLIERASNTPSTATIFAITIFSMLAMLIVGIGIVLAKVDIGENRGATILLSVFPAVFVIGFVAFVVLAFVSPQVRVYMSFPEYADNTDFFSQLGLTPYVDDHVTFNKQQTSTRWDLEPQASATCVGIVPIEFGIRGIRKLEERLQNISTATSATCFADPELNVICSDIRFADSKTCKTFVSTSNRPQK